MPSRYCAYCLVIVHVIFVIVDVVLILWMSSYPGAARSHAARRPKPHRVRGPGYDQHGQASHRQIWSRLHEYNVEPGEAWAVLQTSLEISKKLRHIFQQPKTLKNPHA